MLYTVRVYKGTTMIFEDTIDTEVQAITFAQRVIKDGIRIREGKDQTFLSPNVITKVVITEA